MKSKLLVLKIIWKTILYKIPYSSLSFIPLLNYTQITFIIHMHIHTHTRKHAHTTCCRAGCKSVCLACAGHRFNLQQRNANHIYTPMKVKIYVSLFSIYKHDNSISCSLFSIFFHSYFLEKLRVLWTQWLKERQ